MKDYSECFKDEVKIGTKLVPMYVNKIDDLNNFCKKKYKWIIIDDEDLFYQIDKKMDKERKAGGKAFLQIGGMAIISTILSLFTFGAGTGLALSLAGLGSGVFGFKNAAKAMLQKYDINLDYNTHTIVLFLKKIDENNDTICGVPYKYLYGSLSSMDVDKMKIHSKKRNAIKEMRDGGLDSFIGNSYALQN